MATKYEIVRKYEISYFRNLFVFRSAIHYMAHTKSAGSTKYGRDSQPKYLGVKKHDGETVKIGDILIRQRGTKYHLGMGVKQGRDDTIFAIIKGIVRLSTKQKMSFSGARKRVTVVSVASA